jgi:hypothetical protein|tara:strand:+ start:1780 stop:2136 length:357 start_codon:yes stop_codon:yes gene_type:complete
MANPNIVNVATINGKTDTFALTTTETNLVTATANTVFKINSIMIANIDGTNAADVTIKYNDGSTDRAIASTISVPADATLSLVDKNNGFYLEETEIIKGTASANSDLECLISYEVISD